MTKTDLVYNHLKSKIITFKYTHGYRLVVRDIADGLNVSPLPVREAISRLAKEGMVAMRKNFGAQVQGINRDLIRDELESVAILEGVAGRLSLKSNTANLDLAEELNEKMRILSAQGDMSQLAALNQQFHEALCMPCPNKRIEFLLRQEWSLSKIVMESAYEIVPDLGINGVHEHERILDVARKGDSLESYEAAIRDHRVGNILVYDEIIAQRV